ncbi:MAG: hypothetical protein WD451_14325, partial [Thermoanaerobaculia bacterium]
MSDDLSSLPPALLAEFKSFLREKSDGEVEVVDDRGFVDFVYEHREQYPFLGGLLKLNEDAIREHVERTGEAPAGLKVIKQTTREGDNVTKLEILWGEGTREELAPWRPSPERKTADGSLQRKTSGGRGRGSQIGGEAAPSGGGSATGPTPLPLAALAAPQAITSCSTAVFVQAGVAWIPQPPFTVTVTDLTPSTGQSQQNGVVDAAGIHGHRIEKTIRLKIEITDATGQPPNYPVLVHLSLAGPAHGKLILDPDGNRVECDQASFLWHERDGQGNIIALNEEVEYRLGRFAPYVGAVPDPANPGQLKPVWGTGEMLRLILSTVDQNGINQQLQQSIKVHPEPGKPDHFAVSVPPPPQGTPDPVWTYWADWKLSNLGLRADGQPKLGRTELNSSAYYLMDQYDNSTFGYTGLVQPPSLAPNVTLTFAEQTAGVGPGGTSTADPRGYGFSLAWHNDPAMPLGGFATSLELSYPTDPEWGAGAVSEPVAIQFDRGTLRFLAAVEGWDCLLTPPCVAYDPLPPWVVSPEAVGDALPKSANDPDPEFATASVDPARVAFLIGRGDQTPAYPQPVFTGTTVVETSDNPRFKVSLVDSQGKVATDALFQVHLCPRYDHFPPGGVPRDCTTSPVPSGQGTGVIESLEVNADGPSAPDGQGYMGVEILKAPANPGAYYIYFENLGVNPVYRIRQQGDIYWDKSTGGEYKGAWHLLTVAGGEFLDSGFRRFPNGVVKVTEPTTVYLRYLNPSGLGPATAMLTSTRRDDTILQTGVSLAVAKIGTSSTYVGTFTAVPEAFPGSVSPPSIFVPLGDGHLKAVQQTSASATILPQRLRPEKAQSIVGSLLAFAPSAFPGTLRLMFMTRDSSAVSPVDGANPYGKQQTEIGGKDEDYPEKLWVEIQAYNENNPTQIQDTSAPVGIVEFLATTYVNPSFYDGANGSTLLDDSGKIGGAANGSFAAMVNGRVQIQLTAVATARILSSTGKPDPTLPYLAQLKPVPSDPSIASMPKPGIVQPLKHWVDERTYERRRTDTSKSWGAVDTTNTFRDWLEKKVWDLYTDRTDGGDPELANAFSTPTTLLEDTSLQAGAKVTANKLDATQYKKITWNPITAGLRLPVEAWVPEAGYRTRVDLTLKYFDSITIHEARHCWQFGLSTPLASGGDGLTDSDNDWLLATPPISAKEIWDSNYVGAGGSNTDFHFYTDGTIDTAGGVAMALERDAIRRAKDAEGNTLECVIDLAPALDVAASILNPPPGANAFV